MFHYHIEKAHRCVALGCVFNELGIPNDMLGVVISLLEDRERAGYRKGLARAEQAIIELSSK